MTPHHPSSLNLLLHDAFRYAMALTHDQHHAEELVQRACLAMVRTGAPWTREYLFRVTKHRFLDSLKERRGVEGRTDSVVARIGPTPVPTDDPERLEQSALLHEALRRLRAQEREVIHLAAVHGWSAGELSRFLDLPRSTVLSLLHRSRRKLLRILEAKGVCPSEHPANGNAAAR